MGFYRPPSRFLVAALALPALLACAAAPVDPEGTRDRVTGGTIRAGITMSPPWTLASPGGPGGVEVALLEDLARELDADIEWTEGSEESLIGALELGQLDVVIGGMTAESPWTKHAALTHPYFTSSIVVAAPGSSSPADIAGLEVAVEPGTEAAGLLEKTDAVVRYVDDVSAADGLVAIDDWLLDDLDLHKTGVVLSESDHVMAVRMGENGWMVTLEKFLLERAGEIPELLDEAGS